MIEWTRFPETKFIKENNINEQIMHLKSEVQEVEKANKQVDIAPRIRETAMELLDVIQSAETALRILNEKYDADIERYYHEVLIKNRERGYYD